MASLFLAAGMLGRQRSAITGLAFAAAIMTGANPQTLWDVSFQMSFLAMAGLVSVSPFLQSWGREAVSRVFGEDGVFPSAVRYVTDSLGITLGVLVAVWPLIAYYFGIISLVAPVATLLALPALPLVIVTGAVTAGLGLIIIPVAQVVGWLAWLCASWMLLVVTGMAGIPGASIEAASVNAGPVLAYYVAFAAAIWLRKYWPQASGAVQKGTSLLAGLSRRWVLPPLVVAAVLAIIVAVDMPDDNLHVSFLDVGQGDAILIQTPSRQDILVDGGLSPRDVVLALGKKMPFWDRTIDLFA
jgi:competence protein ComEC